MYTISYIIGYRHEEFRFRNFKIVLKWLKKIKTKLLKYRIDLKIVVVEQDAKQNLTELDKDIKYVFVYNNGYYNRGWGFNVGFKFYYADYYFFADCDIILSMDDMIDVFINCNKYDAVNPYNSIYDSTDDYVKTIDLYKLHRFREFPERMNICFSGGICGLTHQSVNVIAGWDERFRGRGWEDYAFTAKINLFLYKTKKFNFKAVHLWHPFENNTTKEINEELNDDYINYLFEDYMDIILKSPEIGSFIKYSTMNKNTIRYHKNHLSINRIENARQKYKTFFNRVSSKNKHFYNKDIYILLSGLKEHDDMQLADSGGNTVINVSNLETPGECSVDLYNLFP